MSNTVFVETTLILGELLGVLRKSPISSFIAVEIRPDEYRQTMAGWLPRGTWEFIQRKAARHDAVGACDTARAAGTF
jgi:hypothetical protein